MFRPLHSLCLGLLALSASAAVIDKANNTSNLNTTASWVGSVAPGTNDTGQWSATVTSSNAVALGGNLAWQVLKVANTGGDVTLLPGNTLTLLSGGTALDLGAATRDLDLRGTLAVATDQTWVVTAGRTLRLNGTVAASGQSVTRNGGGTVLLGSGTNTFYDLYHGGGTFMQTGGVLTIQNYYRVANYATATSIFSGGSCAVNGILMIGYGAGGSGGTMIVTGNASVTAAEVRMTQANAGRLLLDGGTLACNFIGDTSGQSELTFNGGALRARQDRTDFLQGLNLAQVSAGGMRLDDRGFDLTIAQPLVHATSLVASADGGFAKGGAGTLTLTATNSYNGPAVLSNGTLVLNGLLAGTGHVSVLNGATLTGAGGASGILSVANGGTFAPTPNGTNAFAVDGLVLSNAAVLKVGLGGASGTNVPDVAVAGNLTLDGQLWITNATTPTTGSVWTIATYGGVLTNLGLTIHPYSSWDATIDTNLPGRVRVVLTRSFPFVDIATNFLTATGTTAELSVDLHGLTTNAVWYETRDDAGRLWDFGAHAPTSPFPFRVRHLREGTNTVTVFARTGAGTIASNQIRLALNLGTNPAVRPRPWPAEVWWGGTSHQNIYSNSAIVGTRSELSEFLAASNQWDYVKQYQDGFFLHGYVWVNNAARMTNWTQVGRSLATQCAPHRVRFWLENGWRPRTNDMNYGHSSASGQLTDVQDLQGVGLHVSEITQDYNPMIRDFSATYPTWPQRDLMALGTGDTNGVSPAYPYTTGQWRDYLLDFRNLCPQAQVGWTWSPVYFHWKTWPAIADEMIFTLTNGTNVVSFNYDFFDFHASAWRKGQEAGRPFAFASDCPYNYYGEWANPSVRATNVAKIIAYESWLQTNGLRHTLICNYICPTNLEATPDTWDLTYKNKSLAMVQAHQLGGGRALRYLLESWYAGPYTILPETKSGSYANLALETIRYVKGIADTNGTLDQLSLTNTLSGLTNTMTLRNHGGVPCLPALNAYASGATGIVVRFFASNGVEITDDVLGTDGWSPTNLLATGATLVIRAVATLPAQLSNAVRNVTLEAFWNPQDPGGIVRDRVQWTYGDTQPDPWASEDVGGVGAAGLATFTNGTVTLRGAGADIGGTADEFRFFYRPFTGDGSLQGRVVSIQNIDAGAKAGIMMRESLATNAPFSFAYAGPSNVAAHLYRELPGAAAQAYAMTNPPAATWFRLERHGQLTQSYYSTNGIAWNYRKTSFHTNLPDTILWGLAVTSRKDTQLCEAVFDNFTMNGQPEVTTTPTSMIVVAGATLVFTNTAVDVDLPGQTLTWSRTAGPTGAVVDATNGLVIWRPPAATPAQVTTVVVRATDNGTPPLFATQTVQLVVTTPSNAVQTTALFATSLTFTVGGSAGPDYILAASSNLVAWTNVATASNATPPVTLVDPSVSNRPLRFYRIQLGP